MTARPSLDALIVEDVVPEEMAVHEVDEAIDRLFELYPDPEEARWFIYVAITKAERKREVRRYG